jgi:hypothetical protein
MIGDKVFLCQQPNFIKSGSSFSILDSNYVKKMSKLSHGTKSHCHIFLKLSQILLQSLSVNIEH